MSEPVAGNHNDLYNIEVQFEDVTATLEQAEIPVEGLFLSADAGFDSKELRGFCYRKEIQANICFNKRKGNSDGSEYFDTERYKERYAVERTNAWIVIVQSYIDLIPQQRAGRVLITCLLW